MKFNNFLTIIYEYIQLVFSCLLILSFATEGFDRADLCGFAGGGEAGDGAGDDQQDCGSEADVQADRRIFKDRLLEKPKSITIFPEI